MEKHFLFEGIGSIAKNTVVGASAGGKEAFDFREGKPRIFYDDAEAQCQNKFGSAENWSFPGSEPGCLLGTSGSSWHLQRFHAEARIG